MNINDQPPEILLQHGLEHVRVKFMPTQGCIYLRKIADDGTTVPSSQEIIEIASHPGLECLHDGRAWYPPLLMRVLRFYDDLQEEHEHVRLGGQVRRSLRRLPSFISRHYGNKNSQTPVW